MSSGSGHLGRLEISLLPNGNRVLVTGTPLESVPSKQLGVYQRTVPSCHLQPQRSYPEPNSEGRGRSVVLHRVDGCFKFIRCGKTLKNDQNIKNHTLKCHGNGKDEDENLTLALYPSAANISGTEPGDAEPLMTAEYHGN